MTTITDKKTIRDAIDYSAASETAKGAVFSTLRDVAKKCQDSEQFLNELLPGEDSYMTDLFNNTPPIEGGEKEFKTKDGRWKYRKHLPNSYTSSKSVLKNAIEKGIDVSNKSKSAIEKEMKEAKAEKESEKTDAEKARIVAETFQKIYTKLDEGDQAEVWAYISEITGH